MGVAGVTHRSARGKPRPATPFARLRACHTTAPARWLSVFHLFPLLNVQFFLIEQMPQLQRWPSPLSVPPNLALRKLVQPTQLAEF